MVMKLWRRARRVIGRRDYEELRQDEAEQRISAFDTHPTQGLSNASLSSLLSRYGPNEFELPPSEALVLKFAKQVYENPLILLLIGSSVVSALMGQYDDAVCVVIAVTIVLTGAWPRAKIGIC